MFILLLSLVNEYVFYKLVCSLIVYLVNHLVNKIINKRYIKRYFCNFNTFKDYIVTTLNI